jgi:hypothetical protein
MAVIGRRNRPGGSLCHLYKKSIEGKSALSRNEKVFLIVAIGDFSEKFLWKLSRGIRRSSCPALPSPIQALIEASQKLPDKNLFEKICRGKS